MNHELRLKHSDSMQTIVAKMSGGNPGAMGVILEMLTPGAEAIDPDNGFGGLAPILFLDKLGIYSDDIYVLHSDICKRKMAHTLAVLRAVQFGFFSREILKDACSRQDYSGCDMVPVEELYAKVTARLPRFNAAVTN